MDKLQERHQFTGIIKIYWKLLNAIVNELTYIKKYKTMENIQETHYQPYVIEHS